jgi:hypothetical protein
VILCSNEDHLRLKFGFMTKKFRKFLKFEKGNNMNTSLDFVGFLVGSFGFQNISLNL